MASLHRERNFLNAFDLDLKSPPACVALLPVSSAIIILQPTPLSRRRSDPGWLDRHTVPAAEYDAPGYSPDALGIQAGNGADMSIFLDPAGAAVMPTRPLAGAHFGRLALGAVVEVVLQNNAANAFNGDFRPEGGARTAQEQHPFHLHGQHFWVLGAAVGNWTEEGATAAMNLVDPPRRDTLTLPPGGYAVLRFVAANPGTWPLHCHILAHQTMGQMMLLVVAPEAVTPKPAGMPACPAECVYSNAPWTPATTVSAFGP